jgi:asparagine synthase (glutamine-hydrolysing)
MPGIAGIISRRAPEQCQRLVEAMVASMQHEAFYVSGTSFVPEMGMYAGWVAHENSFAGSQPVINDREDFVLVFAGECFLDAETRNELVGNGHDLSSANADWVVALYEKLGDQFWCRLNGLFSGLLIDRRRKKAFLFNDRYGMERVYWSETPGAFYFASEAKALLCIRPELREFDPEGVAQHLGFGCTLQWRSLFRGIQLLPGGSVWSFENGACRKKEQYFSPTAWESLQPISVEEFDVRFQEIFKRILPRYVETDGRIGISLTAGLDSRMIMACLPPTAQKPACYTFTGQSGETLDDRIAARVAAACGLEHQLLRLQPGFISNFAALADRTVFVTDGCFGVTGAHEIHFSEQAHRLAPLRLTGVFGGEVMRGVSTLKRVGISPGLLNAELNRCIDASESGFDKLKEHQFTFGAFRNVPWNLFGSWAASRSQLRSRSPYMDNELVALVFQTPEILRRSSRPALRLVRDNSSILDKIPTDMGYKGDNHGMATSLRRVYAKATFKMDYMLNEGLPNWLAPVDPLLKGVASGLGLLGMHKFLHYRSLFRRELADYANDMLASARVRQSQFWNTDFVAQMASQHRDGHKNYVTEINAVLTLEAIERLLFKELPRSADGLEPRPSSHRPAPSPVNA